jgi:hypothetical protein
MHAAQVATASKQRAALNMTTGKAYTLANPRRTSSFARAGPAFEAA